VFLISGGLTYEMAPNTWSNGTDPSLSMCASPSPIPLPSATAVGTGEANTAAIAASVFCGSVAAAAVLAYGGTDSSTGQWFLPSQDELNEMCNYSRNPAAPPTGACTGAQDSTFAASAFGFSGFLWSSSQKSDANQWFQSFNDGSQSHMQKWLSNTVRPIRAF
jgi:hypothetical protein